MDVFVQSIEEHSVPILVEDLLFDSDSMVIPVKKVKVSRKWKLTYNISPSMKDQNNNTNYLIDHSNSPEFSDLQDDIDSTCELVDENAIFVNFVH